VEEAYRRLKEQLKGKVFKDEPLADYTSLKVGGKADIFIQVESIDDLKLILQTAQDCQLPYFVIGRGSNLLVSDKGFPGIVIKLGFYFYQISIEENAVLVGAAAPLPALARETAKRGFSDFAFAIGIPGSLGGALISNAGAYGSNIGNLVEEVTLISPQGVVQTIAREKLSFGYRKSSLSGKGIILEARLKLSKKGDPREIDKEMKNTMRLRRKTQPLSLPNAGSIFKNHFSEGKEISAGELIEQAGCKGLRFGGAEVSTVHGNFIVNLGNATAQQVYTLLKMVQKRVFQTKKIWLEPEIILVGEFD